MYIYIYVCIDSWIAILFNKFPSLTIVIYSDTRLVSDLARGTPFSVAPVSLWQVSIIFGAPLSLPNKMFQAHPILSMSQPFLQRALVPVSEGDT